MKNMRPLLLPLVALFSLATGPALACDPVSVYAAASTTDALTEVARAFTAETYCEVTTVFASSSTLAKQIEAGAPATLFLSANLDWMDRIEEQGLLAPETRKDILGNDLVLVAPKDEPLDYRFADGGNLTDALGGGRLALGNPDGVPAGIYAKEALIHLGLWDGVAPHVIAGDDVRTALAWVARGEARAGIVYRTDAQISSDVIIVDALSEGSHEPVRYPIALIEAQENDTAREFLAFMSGSKASKIFARFGFTPLDTPVN
ncbi:molybdate ABC transporter substrate-binding protein [Parvibaculum sp.]|jgi:molybdate transport system substrate-binding protein|uniref:molybdate ABC transporter substrate-binding protein n=2 Tax=Parvibaculum sp. TaxID=2024848 RepID=UPI001B2B4D40|nr:molybdate ABC transporter substrate-binding protein [Parvibaculum sp.]MBO6635723.1 molybdate ABC transporter substrate-binding protein [Parvibaculum sp.]MBO6680305.1 molybdate ABC transporter substrate-binding protein [Parvibaculum sp.]MBO6905402.1 molybdate ABC transporter substrate-binding protein [Parvibaculum sp.]